MARLVLGAVALCAGVVCVIGGLAVPAWGAGNCPNNIFRSPGAYEADTCDIGCPDVCSTTMPESCTSEVDCCHHQPARTRYSCRPKATDADPDCVVFSISDWCHVILHECEEEECVGAGWPVGTAPATTCL